MKVAARVIGVGLYHFVIAVVESKKAQSRRVKHWEITLAILAGLSASLAVADDFKTTDGKEYKNAKVSRVEPDGIVLRTKSGISKLYFTELPKEVQARFHYDAAKGNAYFVEQNANLEALRKQQEEAMRQRQEARQSLLLLLILLSRCQQVESKLYRAVTRQLSLSSFTGSGRYAVMARRAVQLEEGLVHIMAVSGVGNTPMARATNS